MIINILTVLDVLSLVRVHERDRRTHGFRSFIYFRLQCKSTTGGCVGTADVINNCSDGVSFGNRNVGVYRVVILRTPSTGSCVMVRRIALLLVVDTYRYNVVYTPMPTLYGQKSVRVPRKNITRGSRFRADLTFS